MPAVVSGRSFSLREEGAALRLRDFELESGGMAAVLPGAGLELADVAVVRGGGIVAFWLGATAAICCEGRAVPGLLP